MKKRLWKSILFALSMLVVSTLSTYCNPWVDEDLGTEGHECFWESDKCLDDLACLRGTCVQRGTLGDDCEHEYNSRKNTCESGLVCLWGTCATPGEEGDACQDYDTWDEKSSCLTTLECVEEICELPADD